MAEFVTVTIRQGNRIIEDIICRLEWGEDGPIAVLPRDRDASLPATVELYQNKLIRLDAPGSPEGLPPKYRHPEIVVVPERH